MFGTVTTYEILLMLDPEGAEAHQDDLIARVRDLVEKGGGTWRSHDAWGRRRLAYEIAKKPEGVYHLVVFESSRGDPRRDLPRAEDRRRRPAPPRDEAHRGLADERAARRVARPGIRTRARTCTSSGSPPARTPAEPEPDPVAVAAAEDAEPDTSSDRGGVALWQPASTGSCSSGT